MLQVASSTGEVAVSLLNLATPAWCQEGPLLHGVAIRHRQSLTRGYIEKNNLLFGKL